MTISHPQTPISSTTYSEVLVKVENVSKKFCRSLKKSLWYGAIDIAQELNPFARWRDGGRSKIEDSRSLIPDLQSPNQSPNSPSLRSDEFWAVNGVSFELRRGECLGLIGHNGAGKTTLLKMLNGLIKPDRGRIEMRGRVGALIALGAGFNPILTGRENVYVNGSILGLTNSEIEEKFDEILDFAEIGEFIDAPVQSYSSGMQVRLGFAVATALKPDILIADEVLAVGDINFRVKCYNRIRDILPKTAVILVSHSTFDIAKTCTSVLLANRGKATYHRSTEDGIASYNQLNSERNNINGQLEFWSEAFIEKCELLGVHVTQHAKSRDIAISLSLVSNHAIQDVSWRVVFFDSSDVPVAEWKSSAHGYISGLQTGKNIFELPLQDVRLACGNYRIVLVMTERRETGYFLRIDRGVSITLTGKGAGGPAYLI